MRDVHLLWNCLKQSQSASSFLLFQLPSRPRPLYPDFTKRCVSIYKTKNIIIEILSGHLDIIKERSSDSVNEPSCGERLVYRSV